MGVRKWNVATPTSAFAEDGHGLVDLEHRMAGWERKKKKKEKGKTKREVHQKITERCVLR
jgi:hypothetical protein